MPLNAISISDVGVSNAPIGNQVSNLRVGDSAYIQVPGASIANLKVCFENMAIENSCRKFSDFSQAQGEHTISGGVITFRIPIVQGHAGRSYVAQFYDTARNVYHMTP